MSDPDLPTTPEAGPPEAAVPIDPAVTATNESFESIDEASPTVVAEVAAEPGSAAGVTDENGLPPDAETAVSAPTGRRGRRSSPARANRRRRGRWVLITAMATIGLVLVGGGTAVFANQYYADRVNPGVELDGVSLAGMTAPEVEATVADLVADKAMTVTIVDGHQTQTVTVQSAELGLTVDVEATAQAALQQGHSLPLFDVLRPWRSQQVDFVTTVDSDQTKAWIQQELSALGQPATDAGVVFDEASDTFTVTPAARGTAVDTAILTQALDQWAADPTAAPAVELTVAEQTPDIPTAAAETTAAAANARLGQTITVTTELGSYSPSQAARVRWTQLTPNPTAGTIDLTYDASAMAAELPEALNETLEQSEQDKKILTAANGTVLGVQQEGLDGVLLTDPTAVVEQIASALETGQPLSLAAPTKTEKYQTITESVSQAAGGKWIDVNLSTYRVTAYVNDAVAGSFYVSYGMPGYDTPTGVWTVSRSYERDRMIGQILPSTGKPEYDLMVDWVTYFTDDGVAFHSAPWAAPFGSNVSHGCVNMAPGDARWIYNWAQIGVPVVVHY
ncbi:MAG: L,D-transpeptidase/peptidoglycan binding protein [Propionibacteriaceae bacterium]|jgi:lipoprotein-anchoring transpeptidase ErfK/SrfK|nr:L,D-transpeptidase/peptidoglycan binding protein [Propionibacteriaceae bacterium]